jgi:hypothetical protein
VPMNCGGEVIDTIYALSTVNIPNAAPQATSGIDWVRLHIHRGSRVAAGKRLFSALA